VAAESVLANSDIFPVEITDVPKCMATVVVDNPEVHGAFLKAGNCIRYGDSILLPQHVLAAAGPGAPHVWILRGDKFAKLSLDDKQLLCPDVIRIKTTSALLAPLGLAAARPATLVDATMATASSFCCAGRDGEAYNSNGLVQLDNTVGLQRYFGSTTRGFSGGCYGLGGSSGRIAGMHLRRGPAGSDYNVGVSLGYLAALITMREGTNEDTAEWLMQAVKSNRARFVDTGEGYYVFEHMGKYIAVDSDEYDNLASTGPGEDDFDPDAYQIGGADANRDYNPKELRGKAKPKVDDEWEDEDGEAADDIRVPRPGYKEDSFLVRGGLRSAEAPDPTQYTQQTQQDCIKAGALYPHPIVGIEPVRLVTSGVIERITNKAEAEAAVRFWTAERANIIQLLDECSMRFRLAGSDLEKHDRVRQEYDTLLTQVKEATTLLKSANVRLTELSALTAEEKKQAQRDAAARKKQRQAGSTQQAATAMSSAPLRASVSDADDEGVALKPASSTRALPAVTKAGIRKPGPPRQRAPRNSKFSATQLEQLARLVQQGSLSKDGAPPPPGATPATSLPGNRKPRVAKDQWSMKDLRAAGWTPPPPKSGGPTPPPA